MIYLVNICLQYILSPSRRCQADSLRFYLYRHFGHKILRFLAVLFLFMRLNSNIVFRFALARPRSRKDKREVGLLSFWKDYSRHTAAGNNKDQDTRFSQGRRGIKYTQKTWFRCFLVDRMQSHVWNILAPDNRILRISGASTFPGLFLPGQWMYRVTKLATFAIYDALSVSYARPCPAPCTTSLSLGLLQA